MLLSKRISVKFVHGLAFGFELLSYTAIVPSEAAKDFDDIEQVLNDPDTEIKERAGLLLHFGPFKVIIL